MPLQQRNSENVALLSSDFQLRYEATYSWTRAVSMYLMLLGLRGFWPMSSFNEAGNAYDLSGQGRTLTRAGNTYYIDFGTRPLVYFDGTGDWLTRTDEAGLDILGTETYVNAGRRGLSMGGWFYLGRFTVIEFLMNKWGGTPQKAYAIYHDGANNRMYGVVSVDGTAEFTVGTPGGTTATGWHFIALRFRPSTELRLCYDGVWYTNNVGCPASIFNSNADFRIGCAGSGSNGFQGYATLCWLCASQMDTDSQIDILWHHTRALFER